MVNGSDHSNQHADRQINHPSTHTHLQQKIGGARRDRTDDILLAKQALSQLSYGPNFMPHGSYRPSMTQLKPLLWLA
jgi:hypothetical protein